MSAESEHPGPSCEAEDAPVEKTNKSNKYVENGKPGPSTEKDVQKQEANGAEVTGGQNFGSAADDAASQKQKRSLKDASKADCRYRYGNYNRYYGSRLKDLGHDPRLDKLPKSWFRYKSVLDIGCNVGYLTIELAKNFGPWRVVGIDIDDHLVGVARKNIRHYCDKDVELAGKYPASFKNPPETDLTVKFPDNVWFYKENYVLDEDWMLDSVQPEYDVILALSITKWIHLNWGDDGVKRFFRRVFKHLRPGGKFIVEPQEFSSYKKKSRLTPEINANYKAIKFLPEHFDNFLVNNVGFVTCQSLGIPKGARKGFDRPLVVYHKRDPRSKKTFGEPGQTGGWDPLFTKEREQLGKQKGVKRPLENSSTDEDENPAKKADK